MEIQGYPNYLIYTDGRVWSKSRRGRTGKFLNGWINSDGYKNVSLNQYSRLIHRLVAQAYIPNPKNKLEVHHEDGNKQNNDISNLSWVTHLENMNAFQPIRKDNTSGIKNVHYDNTRKKWRFKKHMNGKCYKKYCNTKYEAIWCKFIFLKTFN
tara:strand:+ start:73 stop:531 length:459 start_codon:yes stop_codon:yes gene_type:complete